MKRRHLLLLLVLLPLGCSPPPPLDPATLIGLTPQQVEARLGMPRGIGHHDSTIYAEDATEAEKQEFFATTASETWEYSEFSVVFNLNNVVLEVTPRQ